MRCHRFGSKAMAHATSSSRACMLMRVAASLPPLLRSDQSCPVRSPGARVGCAPASVPSLSCCELRSRRTSGGFHLVWLDPREVRESFVAQIGPEVEVYACFTPGDQKLPNSNWQWSCMPSWPEPSPFGGVAASGISIISRRSCR